MKKTLNILLIILVPIIFAIQNYILIEYQHPLDKYFLIGAFVIMLITSIYTGVFFKFSAFLKKIKNELKIIHWIKNDEAAKKLLKLLILIVMLGIIIALMDKGISIFISKTLLSLIWI